MNSLHYTLGFVPIDKQTLHIAADLWARLRNFGKKTSDDKALDGDVILCAQAIIYEQRFGQEVVIATSNLKHLTLLTKACLWQDIKP